MNLITQLKKDPLLYIALAVVIIYAYMKFFRTEGMKVRSSLYGHRARVTGAALKGTSIVRDEILVATDKLKVIGKGLDSAASTVGDAGKQAFNAATGAAEQAGKKTLDVLSKSTVIATTPIRALGKLFGVSKKAVYGTKARDAAEDFNSMRPIEMGASHSDAKSYSGTPNKTRKYTGNVDRDRSGLTQHDKLSPLIDIILAKHMFNLDKEGRYNGKEMGKIYASILRLGVMTGDKVKARAKLLRAQAQFAYKLANDQPSTDQANKVKCTSKVVSENIVAMERILVIAIKAAEKEFKVLESYYNKKYRKSAPEGTHRGHILTGMMRSKGEFIKRARDAQKELSEAKYDLRRSKEKLEKRFGRASLGGMPCASRVSCPKGCIPDPNIY